MMIKQRIFRTNSLMVLFSLVILLLIGGSMISIFKDRFLGWYSDNSKIAENYVDRKYGFFCWGLGAVCEGGAAI